MFEKAARMKLRFESQKGLLTVEDLFDIPLLPKNGNANLDDIAKGLSRKLKESDSESFVLKTEKTDEVTALKLDIVKHIIAVRLAEQEKVAQARELREKKQQLLGIISQKENQALMDAPLEELRKKLEELEV